MATVGTNSRSIERALAASAERAGVIAIMGRHPHESEGFAEADLEEIERACADGAARAIGETGLDYYRDYAPGATSGGPSRPSSSLAGASDCPS